MGVLVFSTLTIINGDIRDKTLIELSVAENISNDVEKFILEQEVYIENLVDGVYLNNDELYLVLNPEKLLKLKIN